MHVPIKLRRGDLKNNEEASIQSAVHLIDYMCRLLGFEDLGDKEVLDMGCGVKFTQAIINHDLPIKKYVGVDVTKEIIEFLRQNIQDPRFEFYHMNTHNQRYNPAGDALTEDTIMPFGDKKFDLISFFSVFTHLTPKDYRLMLKLMRRYIRPNGKLLFSLLIDELTEKGFGLVDRLAKVHGNNIVGKVKTFKDVDKKNPLKCALYSRDYAYELIEGTGFKAIRLDPPDKYIQHHFTCVPI